MPSGPTPSTTPAAGTNPAHYRFQYAKIRMGVRVDLVGYAADEPSAEKAAIAAFDRVTRVDATMSDYQVKSELNRLCAAATTQPGVPVKVSDELFLVLETSQEMAALSGGAFDVTVGPYVALWRQARKSGQLPSAEELAKAKALVGWQKLKLDKANQTAALMVPGMKLDLGGIAKGYAGDVAIAALRENGVKSALFEAGGDIVLGDAPPGEEGWKIIVWHRGEPESAKRELKLANCAISSSGDTEQYAEIDGKRYSHVIDPRTGLGLTERWAVTVIAPNGTLSDALSTTGCLLGEEKFEALIRDMPGVRAYVRRVP